MTVSAALPDTRLTAAEARLESVLAAVERHRSDNGPDADARLYQAVLSEADDAWVDHPLDWPRP